MNVQELAAQAVELAKQNPCTVAAGTVGAYAALSFLRFMFADADSATAGSSKKRLDGKLVWVTGASSGIGEELAKQLVQLGAFVVISARRMSELQRVQASCADPSKVLCVAMDLVKRAEHYSIVKKIQKEAKEKWGVGAIDILVNNGGQGERSLVEEHLDNVENEQWMMEVNYLGTVSVTKAVLNNCMLPRGAGRVVNVTSIAGRLPAPAGASYAAAKHAVMGWSNTLRLEMAPRGVTVLTVLPGPVATNFSKNCIDDGGKVMKEEAKALKASQYMTSARCAELAIRAICNPAVTESWTCPQPILTMGYVGIYLPSLLRLAAGGLIKQILEEAKERMQEKQQK